jgi:hypothetical protein
VGALDPALPSHESCDQVEAIFSEGRQPEIENEGNFRGAVGKIRATAIAVPP